MINISDIVQSSGWKNFMAKLYGWGASVVIIGAMFKINHWPGGTFVITLGMVVEAVIFFFSAFEPLHEELDWTLVYPELAGMADPDEIEKFKENVTGEDRPIERIEDILQSSGVDDEALKKLGDGFNKLNRTAANLSDITKASVVTQEFFSNLQSAANSVSSFNTSYTDSAQHIQESTHNLTDAYKLTAETIAKSGDDVANTYKTIAKSIQNEHQTIENSTKSHEEQLEILNKNLSALNSVYEMQIKDGNEHMKGTSEVYSGLQEMIKKLKESIDETNKYKEEISKLKENISSLNNVYGNMLSSIELMTSV
jgi:gliding motility-associated protein GldL